MLYTVYIPIRNNMRTSVPDVLFMCVREWEYERGGGELALSDGEEGAKNPGKQERDMWNFDGGYITWFTYCFRGSYIYIY